MKTKLIVKRSRIAITCTRRRWSSWNIWSLVKYPGYLRYFRPCFRFGKNHACWSERQSSLFEIPATKYSLFILHHTLCNEAFIIVKENHEDISCDASRNHGFYGAIVTYSRLEYSYYRQGGEREFHLFATCDKCLKKQQPRKANGLAIFWEWA